MRIVSRIAGTVLFALAVLLVLVGLGVLGADKSHASVLDSPEASGRMIGGLLPALILFAGSVWLWQRPKRT